MHASLKKTGISAHISTMSRSTPRLNHPFSLDANDRSGGADVPERKIQRIKKDIVMLPVD